MPASRSMLTKTFYDGLECISLSYEQTVCGDTKREQRLEGENRKKKKNRKSIIEGAAHNSAH